MDDEAAGEKDGTFSGGDESKTGGEVCVKAGWP